ncbi:hypothetical protein B0H13DRAFT_2031293 [Mycena leptocephala]|nr:hypothetical protein B0H13DRAFT_2031293 [Mycena leptocephala]
MRTACVKFGRKCWRRSTATQSTFCDARPSKNSRWWRRPSSQHFPKPRRGFAGGCCQRTPACCFRVSELWMRTFGTRSQLTVPELPSSHRDTSLPAIATLHLPSAPNSGGGAVLSGRKLRCHPCGENGFVTEDSDPIACQKCGNWSHIRCVQPLAYENSDSEAKSQLSWHSPQFLFVCTVCKVRHNFTPECDVE